MEVKEKTQEERRTKFKPILQEELAQFSNKVDQIVSYLTRKRGEERNNFQRQAASVDLAGLRTQTYEQVVEKDREGKEATLQEKQGKVELLHRRRNYASYVKQVHLPPKSEKKAHELQSLVAALKHPVKQAVKPGPGAPLDNSFFAARRTAQSAPHMRGARPYQRNPKAYPDGVLPPIAEKNGQQADSGDAPGGLDGNRMDLKSLYKSNSYKNMQQAYVGGRMRRLRGGALAHLEQVDGPGALRRAGPRDYLNEIRDKRVARETKMSNAGRVR